MILQLIQRLGQLRWRGFVILLAVAAMVTGLLTLIVLTEEVLEEEPHGFDDRILLVLREPQDLRQLVGPSWLEHASVNLTALGSVSVLTLLTALVFGYLVVTRKFQSATLLVCAAIGGTALSYTLKFLVGRDRPQVVPHLAEISDFSYPSGHSMLSTVIFLTLAVILAQTVESRRAKIYLIVAALFVAFVVGVTRVLIGVHYPTDVMAGWAAGTVWALFCWLLAEWLRNRGIWKPHLYGVLIALIFVPSLRSAEQTLASPIPEAAAIDPATAPPDEKIAARLEQIFSQIDDLSAITVQVQAGVVTLAGEVPGKRSADEALALASKVAGTVYVRNRLEEATRVAARVSPAVVKLRELGNRTVALLPVLGLALLIVAGFWLLGRFLSRRRGLFDFLGLSDLGGELARRVVRTLVVGLGIVIALEILDATAVVGAVLGIAGVAGVALGFAFRNIIENYLAGILLSARNPFRIGDQVEIGAFNGKVVRLTSRDTVLMTLDGNHLRIPNGLVINKELINYTRNPLRRFDFLVGVSVDLDLTHVRSVGLATLRDLKGVLADPPPTILVEALGDSAVNLRFFAWIDQEESDFNKSRSEAIRTVKTAFDQAEIEMPEPIYRVHLRESSQPSDELPQEAKASRPVAESPSAEAPANADVGTDDTIDKQLAAELATSEEPNLLSAQGRG